MITYDRLKLIIPADQALANKALQVALQQIKGISDTTLPALSDAYLALQTTNNLPEIEALTTPLPTSTVDFFNTNYATGSGPDGTLYLTDVIGFPVGGTSNVYTDAVSNIYTTINTLESENKLTTLNNIYTIMVDVNTGVYGNPITGPIANVPLGNTSLTYANATVCYANLLMPEARSASNAIISANANAVSLLNEEMDYLAESILLEHTEMLNAGVDLFDISSGGRTAITSFVQNLYDYGKDTTENGPAWYLEQVTDTGTLAGQSVVGVMREGINIDVLSASGIGQDTEVPDTPTNPPPQANLIPSTVSESSAKANIVL